MVYYSCTGTDITHNLIRKTVNGTVNGASDNGGPLETVDVVLGVDALNPTRENSYIIVSIWVMFSSLRNSPPE